MFIPFVKMNIKVRSSETNSPEVLLCSLVEHYCCKLRLCAVTVIHVDYQLQTHTCYINEDGLFLLIIPALVMPHPVWLRDAQQTC